MFTYQVAASSQTGQLLWHLLYPFFHFSCSLAVFSTHAIDFTLLYQINIKQRVAVVH